MRYYLIKEDKGYYNSPDIINWYGKFDVQNLKPGRYDRVPDKLLFRIREGSNTIFTDVITMPFFLLSPVLKECVNLFEPNLDFREFILLDKKNRKAQEYFLPMLSEIACLTKNSQYNLDHSELNYIEIDLDQVEDKSIFILADVKNRHVIVRLDLAESMLRRKAIGFVLEEVNCVKGGTLCLRM